jgi:hypothetical protein
MDNLKDIIKWKQKIDSKYGLLFLSDIRENVFLKFNED